MEEKKEEEKNKLNLSRQAILVPIDKINNYTIKVFGVGSIGSHVVKCLAKTGFKSIEVYDMDIVEEENIAAQAYDFRHIGINKVDAMKEIIKDSCGVEIKAIHGEIIKDTTIEVEPNIIYCCFFDSFEARKLIFEKIKDYPTIFVDGRIGKFDMRHYLIDLTNKEFKEQYGKSLETKAVSELACGEKASAPVNLQISGMIVMNIINFIKGEDYTRIFIGNASTPDNNFNVLVYRTSQLPKEEGVEENILPEINEESIETFADTVIVEE